MSHRGTLSTMPAVENVHVWGDARPLYTYTRYIQNHFGERVQKLAVDAGLSCPHRTQGRLAGGCTYCNNNAFNPSYCTPSKTIRQQLQEGITFHANRYRRANRYLAYFQAYTNTYAGVDKLRALFEEALQCDGVSGIIIATRPDCLPDRVVEYLHELAQRTYLFVELGAESSHDITLERIRRGHNARSTEEAVYVLRSAGIPLGLHLIWGLPDETPEMMLQTLHWAAGLDIQTLKFHQLQILRGADLAEAWQRTPEAFQLFGLDDYLEFLVPIVEHLRPDVAIERICAEAPPKYLLAPNWGLIRNDEILRRFEKMLLARNTWQGRCWRGEF